MNQGREAPVRVPTLLVIEDTRDQALLVGAAARRAHPGLDVRIANNGVEGVAYFAGRAPFEDETSRPAPDLVILDLFMPELDGFGVLTWLKDNLSPMPFPVVVLTSSHKPEDEERARELGAVEIFSKPGELQALGEVVKGIVHRWIGRGQIIGAHIWSAG